MSPSKSKCWYSNHCLHFSNCAVPLEKEAQNKTMPEDNECCCGDTISKLDSI